jgi:methionyl-tRNA synthetase
MKIDTQIKNMIGKQCANYLNGHCLFAIDDENKCTYERNYPHLGHRRCIYFEEAVLPADQVLEQRYWETITGDTTTNKQIIDQCDKCGKEIVKTHGKQKYCHTCAKQIDKDKARERMKRKRRRDLDADVTI